IAGREEKQAGALARTVAAEPTGEVIAKVTGEVREHVDETDGHRRRRRRQRDRGQRPEGRWPEIRRQARGAKPRHDKGKRLSGYRAAREQQRRRNLPARAMPLSIAAAVRRLAGHEHADQTTGIEKTAVEQRGAIG